MKKYVFCIPASTDFALATAVLIYSIKKNLKIVDDCDFVVPYNDLSERAMEFIRKSHADVKFEKPKDNSFYKEIPKTIYGPNNHDVYLSFEAFWQDGYEKSIYLDADMLCINDFSEIILNNEGISWKYPNLGTVVIGKPYLSENTYRKLIKTTMKHYRHKPGGDQSAVNHLFGNTRPNRTKSNANVTYINDSYNFQHIGGGGKGSNELFLSLKDKVKIIHYSGKRKPWGKVWDSDIYDSSSQNCIYYPFMLYNCEAVKIWCKYFEEFKVTHVVCKSPIEKYQQSHDVIIEDVPDELRHLHHKDFHLKTSR